MWSAYCCLAAALLSAVDGPFAVATVSNQPSRESCRLPWIAFSFSASLLTLFLSPPSSPTFIFPFSSSSSFSCSRSSLLSHPIRVRLPPHSFSFSFPLLPLPAFHPSILSFAAAAEKSSRSSRSHSGNPIFFCHYNKAPANSHAWPLACTRLPPRIILLLQLLLLLYTTRLHITLLPGVFVCLPFLC